jgi:hypothetical protein
MDPKDYYPNYEIYKDKLKIVEWGKYLDNYYFYCPECRKKNRWYQELEEYECKFSDPLEVSFENDDNVSWCSNDDIIITCKKCNYITKIGRNNLYYECICFEKNIETYEKEKNEQIEKKNISIIL